MDKLMTEMKQGMENLNEQMVKAASGNKAAARRARKITLELGKLFLEFRKESVKM